MSSVTRSPLLKPLAIIAVGFSLSIGWGIRGNFGHEYGAMIPGALAALAACMLSGREDWRSRAAYFGMFGALGWGFGGSISYMQVIAYTHSGHLPSQVYGFCGLWLIGFLWAGLGGAGTALPAVLDRERLTLIFVPLAWIFAAWFVLTVVLLPAIEQWESSTAQTWSRHESPLYWFDSDWLQALAALIALGAYDLWDRRKHPLPTAWLALCAFGVMGVALLMGWSGIGATVLLALAVAGVYLACGVPLVTAATYTVAGGLIGLLLHGLFHLTGLTRLLTWLLVQPQGDLDRLRELAAAEGIPYDEAVSELLINWPQFFKEVPHHLGWIIGGVLGLLLYFRLHGQFRRDAGLFVAMACGWFAAFLLMPTLLNFGGAGLRLTPPRGDDWAGILGVFLSTMWWLRRHNAAPVVYVALISGAIGGLGFSGAALLKLMMTAPGNPAIVTDATIVEAWRHYQGSNWHSFLEQTYGFFNGVGIAIALGFLATRKAAVSDTPRVRRITGVFAAAFVLFGVLYLNMQKNVPEWIGTKIVPAEMTAPWFDGITLSAATWFNLLFAIVAAAGLLLMAQHLRRPIAALPHSYLGRAQWLYLLFLWSVCVMNYERALPGFSQGRLLTEGVILVNAAVASVLILLLPTLSPVPLPQQPTLDYGRAIRRATLGVLGSLLLAAALFAPTVRMVYGDSPAGHASVMKRFGPDATWRTMPLLKGSKHR